MKTLFLRPDVIQVWAVWLNCSDMELARLEAVLSPEERTRAAKFAFTRHRQAFIASRGILRNMLARYTGLEPEALDFDYNPYGKPLLLPGCGGNWLHFNVAHSASLALYAVRLGGAVGVDVEQSKTLEDMDQIAANTFSAAENAILQMLPDKERHEAFFACWTRKEALIKALGSGLSYPLKDFDVTLHPGEPARVTRIKDGKPEQWTLVDLRPTDGFVGAVAIPQANTTVQLDWWVSFDHSNVDSPSCQ